MADRELLLRCDCGVEHVDIDLWFSKDRIGYRLSEAEIQAALKGKALEDCFDEGYLTITESRVHHQLWKDRIKSAWAALRGKDYLLTEVVIKPEDYKKMVKFFSDE